MKKISILFPLLAATLLASCGKNNQPISSASSSVESQTSSQVSSSEEKEEFITVDWDPEDEERSKMSLGGTLLDVGIDIQLTNVKYYCTYSFTGTSVVGAEYKWTQNGVMDVVETGDGSFYFIGLKPGQCVLKIYDAQGMLHFRDLITFRPALSVKEVQKFAFEEVNYYEGLFTKQVYRKDAHVTWTSTSSGTYSGSDESISLYAPIKFSFEFKEETEAEYIFTIIEWDNKESGTELVCTEMNVNKNGYTLHLMTRNGVVDIFSAVL